ncbi:MAG: hypothetical protein JSR77_18595 [Planctomycetes bacterium]|nr:hypothetical protein [Planctomycetota bacterium]
MAFLAQVVVAGAARPWTSLSSSTQAMKLLHYRAIRKLSTAKQLRLVNRLFRKHGVRYTSEDPKACRKSAAVIANLRLLGATRGGPKGYLARLCELPEDQRVAKLGKDFGYIRLKGSRDLSATLGLAKDAIALDTRLLQLLRAAGVKLPPRVQGNPEVYRAVQNAILSQICKRAGVTGVQCDRILFNNYEDIKQRLRGPKR